MIIGGNNKEKSKKQRRSMSRFLVPFIVGSIFVFTIAAIWLQLKIGMELSSTLIACFFTFMGSELAMLCSIKRTKVKQTNYFPEEKHDRDVHFSDGDDGSVG